MQSNVCKILPVRMYFLVHVCLLVPTVEAWSPNYRNTGTSLQKLFIEFQILPGQNTFSSLINIIYVMY